MNYQYISVGDTSIAYIEKSPSADKIIFFIHGNSQSSNAWRKQLNDELFSSYHLIAFDLPSHGKSSPAGTVSLPSLAKLMSEAVKKSAGERSYILAGVSLATNIIAEMLAFDLHPVGIVLAGPCVVGENISFEKMMKPDTHVQAVFSDDASANNIRSYAMETSASTEEEDIDFFLNDYKSVQKPFRTLLGKSIFENCFSDEISLLRKSELPLLLVFGEDEKVIDPNYLDDVRLPLWKDGIFKIKGASHLVNIDARDKFNHLLEEYVNDRFK